MSPIFYERKSSMFLKYKPTWMIEAIYDITPEQLKAHGIEAVLTDLDNTLIAWNNPDGTPELLAWIETMKEANIPVIVVSNNKASRIDRAVKHLGLEYVSRAMKPFQKGFNEVERKYNLPKEKLIMIGDQLMTDIKGANNAGIRNVLVKPIVETDAWNTKFNRAREKRIKKHLYKNHPDMKWRKSLND
ncbi:MULTISPECIES: YqeG family HAD IIIA-type phosphatase [Vagococcus]|uniref:YqeG family HAD IIIA-type phosphatase n=1 Tax=Vagococcus TaxID=2737 RepID=UPI002FC761F3